MKPANQKMLCSLLAIGVAAGLSSCSMSSQPRLDAKTDAVLTAMSDKLAAAKTLRVSVTRTASKGFHAGMNLAETSTGALCVQRPDKLAAVMKTTEGNRSVGLSDGVVTLIDYRAGTHSSVKATGDLDQTLKSIEDTYGIMLPAAELTANHPRALLLDGVKSGRCTGTENVGGTTCDHLAFTQDRLSWDLWVATGDNLPRRIMVTYPNGEGGAPLTMRADISKWELGASLSAADVKVAAPAGSRAIDMIPLN